MTSLFQSIHAIILIKVLINIFFIDVNSYFCNILYDFMGGNDELMYALTICVIVDIITSFMLSIVKKKALKIFRLKSLFKNISIYLVIGVVSTLDAYVFKSNSLLRTSTIYIYIVQEGLSLFNNIKDMGGDVPEIVSEALKKLYKKFNHQSR